MEIPAGALLSGCAGFHACCVLDFHEISGRQRMVISLSPCLKLGDKKPSTPVEGFFLGFNSNIKIKSTNP